MHEQWHLDDILKVIVKVSNQQQAAYESALFHFFMQLFSSDWFPNDTFVNEAKGWVKTAYSIFTLVLELAFFYFLLKFAPWYSPNGIRT